MKQWYKLYVSKQHEDMEESFALTNKNFWKLLKDSQILSPKITIAAFNRLYLQGAKNQFEIKANMETLKFKLDKEKKDYWGEQSSRGMNEDVLLREFTLDNHMRNDSEDTPEKENGEINLLNYLSNTIDAHDENRVILFRHFADALVRVAYLKYGGSKELHHNLEKVLSKKIQQNIENKRKLKGSQLEDEQVLYKIKPMFEKYRPQLKEWFKKFPNKSQTFLFDYFDYTVSVKGLLELLTKAKLIQTGEDRVLFLRVAERYYDTEETYDFVGLLKEKEKGIVKPIKPEREAKLALLLQSEIIFLEFFDTFVLYLFKRDGLNLKDAEINTRINKSIEQLFAIAAEKTQSSETLDEIKWPSSKKDEMFKNLKSEHEKREKELALVKQKKLERENEDRETKNLTKEDFNVSHIIDQLKKKDSDVEESFGDDQSFDNDF